MLPRRHSRRLAPGMKTEARLTLERVARFGCDLDSGTQNSIVRATVKVASENKQRRGREAGPELKRSAAIFQGGTHFLLDPLLRVRTADHGSFSAKLLSSGTVRRSAERLTPSVQAHPEVGTPDGCGSPLPGRTMPPRSGSQAARACGTRDRPQLRGSGQARSRGGIARRAACVRAWARGGQWA